MYRDFAYVYDVLMQDIKYLNGRIISKPCFKIQPAKPVLVLDMACGTGNLTLSWQRYDMTGICPRYAELCSGEILELRNSPEGLSGHEGFELYGTMDAILAPWIA